MLLLAEEKLKGLTEKKKTLFLLQWLQQLPQTLSSTPRGELKEKQKVLINQLYQYGLQGSLPPPLRSLLGCSFVALYSSGDASSLFETITKCIEVLRLKDDSTFVDNKLTAIECIGDIFAEHGRMAGSLFPEVVQTLLKLTKSNEYRCDVCSSLEKLIKGLGASSSSAHKDIYKYLKSGLTDKLLPVRSAAAKCILELSQHGPTLYTQDIDSLSQLCLKALEGSDYDVRCSIATLWGTLLALSQQPLPPQYKGKVKQPTLYDILSLLANGFVRGSGSFLKAGGPELLKGGLASRDVRVGVTQTYVFFLCQMGGVWLERNLQVISSDILELLTHPKTIATHIDAVYSRKCVQFIMRSSFSRLLGESSQLAAATYLCKLITRLISGLTLNEGADKEEPPDKSTKPHMIICALSEIGSLVLALNTAALPLVINDNGIVGGDSSAPLIEALNNVLIHSNLATRLSGARCMYNVGLALPTKLTPVLEYLVMKVKMNRGHPHGLVGYGHALASVLSSAQKSQLGVPLAKAEEVFNMGQDLIKIPSDGGNLALASVQCGWALIGAYLSLGPPYIRAQLKTILTLWYSVFPHSHNELTTEMSSGTSLSWKHTFENRIGALTSIVALLSTSCGDLLSMELIKRIMLPLDSVLAMTSGLSNLIKVHGVHLKALSAMIRLRLYQCLVLLPPASYEGCLSTLLREIVAEFTLSENMATTTTSLLRSMCHHDDSILLGSWLEETDHQDVEEMLQPNSAAGSGTIEHDAASTYITSNTDVNFRNPLPLGVAVIDAAITLFGRVFPGVAPKHRLQLLNHFKECVRQSKSAQQQAIQINIITAILAGLKGLVQSKGSFGDDDLISAAYSLIAGALDSSNPLLRCAAGEALGRLAQVVGNVGFVAQIVQMSVNALKTASKDIPIGHALTLGCLHRYVGGMSSGQHLQISVSSLQEITNNYSNPTAQVWSLHALSLIADSGGPLFRNFVDSTLSLLLSLLIHTSTAHVKMYRCLGNCLSALLTTLGPELQIDSETMLSTRQTCLTACAIIQSHADPVVQSTAISCIQQLQLFAPALVSMTTVVPRLYASLHSSHLLLRRSSANGLRQFSQQEPTLVWDILQDKDTGKGLEHTVLTKLDIEQDEKLRFDLKETLFSLLTSLAPNDPMKWLLLCNGVLSAQQNEGAPPSLQEDQPEGGTKPDDDEDLTKFTTGEDSSITNIITPRWPTKVFAVECSRKIYTVCKNDPAHFDMTLAETKKRQFGGDFLVMHLSELVRTSFIAATANVDQLKLAGYQALQDVIELFANTKDPDYQGHVLLEQYQAQIGAALRPAFTPDTAPHVTAMACQVCSEWLGSGVSRHIGDLKRVQQLLVSSLDKLKRQETSSFGEAVATMESLSVLKAWAELYIKVSIEDPKRQSTPDPEMGGDQPNDLVDPHLPLLSQYWLAAIKDHAYLSLPTQFGSQLPPSGGTFYLPVMVHFVRPYYTTNWPSILQAVAVWANRRGLYKKSDSQQTTTTLAPPFASMVPLGTVAPPTDERHDMFHLLMGVAVQALCNPAMYDSAYTIQCCLQCLDNLVKTSLANSILSGEPQLVIELFNVLHRVMLTSHNSLHLLSLKVAFSLASNLSDSLQPEEHLDQDKSCAYTLLVLASCALLKKSTGVDEELKSVAVQLLPTVVMWTSPSVLPSILPSIIYMILMTIQSLEDSPLLAVCLQSWKSLCSGQLPVAILQSTCHSLVNNADDNEFNNLSINTRLMVLSLVLVSPSAELCCPPSQLFKDCVEFLKSCLQQSQLQLKTLQVYQTLFTANTSVANHFIHHLAPEVVKLVQQDTTTPEVVTRAIQLLEVLLELTIDEKKSVMMSMLIPLFVSLFLESPQNATKTRRLIHDTALQRLIAIGPKYPQPFRSVMTSSPELKARLEAAIKSSQSAVKPDRQVTRTGPSSKPTITLKMDFSNFK